MAVSRREIRRFVDQVVRRFSPARVILFGSHAYGHPTADSDVDLMVIMPHQGSGAKAATKIRLSCPRSFPMDLLVRTPAELRRRLRVGDQFLREVMSKGIILHEGHDARVGRPPESAISSAKPLASAKRQRLPPLCA